MDHDDRYDPTAYEVPRPSAGVYAGRLPISRIALQRYAGASSMAIAK